jgi:chromosome segregation ATPase
VKKENESIVQKRDQDSGSSDKSLNAMKQKAELRMASIKKQFENETNAKVEELNAKKYELELKLSEQQKLIDLFQNENDATSLRINQLEHELIELNKTLEHEKKNFQDELKRKDKHLNEQMDQLNSKHKLEYERIKSSTSGNQLASNELNILKKSNQDLQKQLDELRYSYDELNDEKKQLYASLNELKQNKHDSNETMRYKHQIKLNEKKILDLEEKLVAMRDQAVKVQQNATTSVMSQYYTLGQRTTLSSISNVGSLEPTEIDYLKKIVFSYMMGTDSITMAKVIIAILKFDEAETNQLIENEKSKSAVWKFPVLQ